MVLHLLYAEVALACGVPMDLKCHKALVFRGF